MLKCGIHNGKAFLHHFKGAKRSSITIVGSTVNYASRLEGKAEKDEILISKEVKIMIGGEFETEEVVHDIKSYGNSVLFRVLSKRGKATSNASITTAELDIPDRIYNWKLPRKLIIGHEYRTSVSFSGSVKFGCLTLSIKDSNKYSEWYGDPKSYDEMSDSGLFNFKSEKRSHSWLFTPSINLQPGVCHAKVEMYENVKGPSAKRYPIASKYRTVRLMQQK